ncbi:MAG: hypothetical protein JSR77_08455 [Planctomycetes bacterium]|nr:hypothetical protein [Planctomycetota bacterium]
MKTAVGKKADETDRLMEKASEALARTEYFEAETLCMRAWEAARAVNDFERLARICLPLQEARRQRRHEACDAPTTVVLNELPGPKQKLAAGRYLIEPPLVGIDVRTLREIADRQRVPIMALAREPLTRAGKWPIVGVGTGMREPVVVRIQVDPPQGTPSVAWFMATQEALGDAAIAKAPKPVPADHHVDDLMEHLEAVPDHEKLIQALEAACRAAVGQPISKSPRRRPIMDNPYSF